MHRLGSLTAGAALAVAVAGCTAEPPDRGSAPASPSTASPSSPAPRSTASPRTAPPVDPVSVPALFERRYVGGGLRLGQVLARTGAYTSYAVTYRSGDLRISGKLDVPRGGGRHPAVVLAHGYIDPAVYVSGQGMRREQDWLARAGYVVLHVDYRNHAGSSRVPAAELRLRLGYTADVINAVTALRRTTDVAVDDDRIGLVGRSMGGGVVYNVLVARPGLVDAAVVFAPVSSRTEDNFDRWIRDDPARRELADAIIRDARLPGAQPGLLAAGQPATVLRPGHRAGADPPRHVRRHLPAAVEPGHAARPAGGGRGRAAVHLPRRGARVRRAVAAVDAPHHRVPGPRAAPWRLRRSSRWSRSCSPVRWRRTDWRWVRGR